MLIDTCVLLISYAIYYSYPHAVSSSLLLYLDLYMQYEQHYLIMMQYVVYIGYTRHAMQLRVADDENSVFIVFFIVCT